MNQDAQEQLLSPSIVGLGAEGRTQLSLILGKGTFDVDPLSVDVAREATLELATIAISGPLPRAPHVDRRHQRSNAQELSTKNVMMLAVIGSVGQNLIQRDSCGRIHHGRSEVGRVVAGALAHLGRQPQVASGMAQHRQLGELGRPEVPGVGTLAAIVETNVSGFVSGGVDGPLGLFLDQAAAVGEAGDRVEQSIETPFLRRRW